MKKTQAGESAIMRTLRFTRQLLTPAQKRQAIGIILLSIITSFTEVLGLATLVPIVMVCAEPGGVFKHKYFRVLYEGLHFQSEPSFIISLLVGIVVFFILKSLFAIWVNYVQARFTSQIGRDVIESQLHKHMGLKFWRLNDLGSAKLINSSINIPNGYLHSLLRQLVAMASEMVIALGILGGLLAYNPELVVILAVVLVPPMILTYRFTRNKVQQMQSRTNALWLVSLSYISDLFAGFIELRLARRQQNYMEGVLRNQGEAYSIDAVNNVYTQVPQKVIELTAILGVVVILLYSVLVNGVSANMIGLVGAFAVAAYRLMPSMNRILSSIVTIKANQFILDDIESYRNAESQEPVHAVQQPLIFKRSLELQNLTFSFPGSGKPALSHLDIKIAKGEKIGFIGTSGSGKTTLMNVLLRFYTEDKGHILVDGVPLDSQNIDGWHRIVGYIKQDTFLMQASIRDNITLGEKDPDEQRLTYAVEQASLSSVVQNLEKGLDTFIGERGSKLSGGQRQRIGIARALYKRAEVLIMDEATSALDNETEREVNEAISKLSQTNITILIVAHRLTTLRECDRVYELSHGELIAEHQYEALLERIR